jgi:hypothetical protein
VNRSLLSMAAVLILVACSSASPTLAPSPMPTPTLSAMTASPTASTLPGLPQPSPSPTSTPSVTPTPPTVSPTASVSATPNTSGVFEWHEVANGGGLHTWAPDSQHYFVEDEDQVQVFDTAGNPLIAFNGGEPLWLDSGTVDAYDVDASPPKGSRRAVLLAARKGGWRDDWDAGAGQTAVLSAVVRAVTARLPL